MTAVCLCTMTAAREKNERNKRSIKYHHQTVKDMSSLSLFLNLENVSSIQTRGANLKNTA